MKIEILGSGCPNCKRLEANAIKAVEEKHVKAEIVKVTDWGTIARYGVLSTPAIVIDGKIKAYGRVAETKEIMTWI